MNRNNVQTLARRAADTVSNLHCRALAIGATSFLAPALAFAQATDPGAAITSEINGVKTTVGAIIVILAGVVGLMVLWSYIKRAK